MASKLNADLEPILFGHEDCRPSHAYGPTIRGYHLFHFITRGCGNVEIVGCTFSLGAGDAFLIPPGKHPGRITGWESRGFVLLSMFSRFWIFRRSDIFCAVSMCRKLPGRLRGCPVCPAQTLPIILWRGWPWMRFSPVWPQNCPECAVPDIHHHLPHERGHILRRDILKSFQSARWRITSEYIRIICHAHFKMNINAHPSSF